jgi:hypothetical protein
VAVEGVIRRGTMKCYLWRLLFAIAGGIALLPLDAPAQTTGTNRMFDRCTASQIA